MIYTLYCRVVINAEAPYVKMVSEQFDRCHGTLLQYVEFLCSSVTPATAFAQLIPSLDDLVHLYHLEAEVIFSLSLSSIFVCLFPIPCPGFLGSLNDTGIPWCRLLS